MLWQLSANGATHQTVVSMVMYCRLGTGRIGGRVSQCSTTWQDDCGRASLPVVPAPSTRPGALAAVPGGVGVLAATCAAAEDACRCPCAAPRTDAGVYAIQSSFAVSVFSTYISTELLERQGAQDAPCRTLRREVAAGDGLGRLPGSERHAVRL